MINITDEYLKVMFDYELSYEAAGFYAVIADQDVFHLDKYSLLDYLEKKSLLHGRKKEECLELWNELKERGYLKK